MTEAIRTDYEVSSEGAVRHWEIPYARLSDATPTPSRPAQVTCLTAGLELTGTILTIDAGRSMAVIDFTCSMVYFQEVRNVLTYNEGVAELTWGPINVGDCIYYDDGANMAALALQLSTAPTDFTGVTNPLFGYAVARNDTDLALFPKGGIVASTEEVAVMQRGAGAG